MKEYDAVFWDWNGTLVDDVDYNIDCINQLIVKLGRGPIDRDEYHRAFGFPVVNFYKKLGFDFDKESYAKIADAYIAAYNTGADDVPLRAGVKEALAVYADKGLKQFILTASEKKIVEHGLACRGIDGYFTEVLGLDNFLAGGKTDVAKKYLSQHPEIRNAVMIGDTLHDLETARELGMDCVLLRGGHASDEKLSSSGAPVVDGPNKTYRYVLQTGRGYQKSTVDLSFVSKYKSFYDDLKNTNKTEDW